MIFLSQVLEKTFAAVHKSHQSVSGAVVFLVGAHVFGNFRDTGGKKGDLDFGGTDVAFLTGVLCNDLSFFCFFQDV